VFASLNGDLIGDNTSNQKLEDSMIIEGKSQDNVNPSIMATSRMKVTGQVAGTATVVNTGSKFIPICELIAQKVPYYRIYPNLSGSAFNFENETYDIEPKEVDPTTMKWVEKNSVSRNSTRVVLHSVPVDAEYVFQRDQDKFETLAKEILLENTPYNNRHLANKRSPMFPVSPSIGHSVERNFNTQGLDITDLEAMATYGSAYIPGINLVRSLLKSGVLKVNEDFSTEEEGEEEEEGEGEEEHTNELEKNIGGVPIIDFVSGISGINTSKEYDVWRSRGSIDDKTGTSSNKKFEKDMIIKLLVSQNYDFAKILLRDVADTIFDANGGINQNSNLKYILRHGQKDSQNLNNTRMIRSLKNVVGKSLTSANPNEQFNILLGKGYIG
jgi:hypothetical protein